MTNSYDSWLDDLTKHVAKKLEDKAPQVELQNEQYECETCEDTGHHMSMVCYGGPPIEIEVYCVDCAPPRLRGTRYGC